MTNTLALSEKKPPLGIILNTLALPLYCWFDHFLYSRTEICQNFRWFFGKFRTPKRHSEINWPLTFQINHLDTKQLLEVMAFIIYLYMLDPVGSPKKKSWLRLSALCDIWYGNWQRNENKKRSICAKFMNSNILQTFFKLYF